MKSKEEYQEYYKNQLNSTQRGNVDKIVSLLRGYRLNDYAIAGICGNCFAESSFYPTVVQGHDGNLKYGDDYTYKVNSGIITEEEFVGSEKDTKPGYGLFQFTWYSKRQKLYNEARAQRGMLDIGSINAQLLAVLNDSDVTSKTLRYYAISSGNVIANDGANTESIYGNSFISISKDENLLPINIDYYFSPTTSTENKIIFYTTAFLGSYERPEKPSDSWNKRKQMALAVYYTFENKNTINEGNTYVARLSAPKDTADVGIYYKSPNKKGINSATTDLSFNNRTSVGCPVNFDVLPNCVGYAHGRFLELAKASKSSSIIINDPVSIWNQCNVYGNPVKYTDAEGKEYKLYTGYEPAVGALIVWKKTRDIPKNKLASSTAGHIAVVEKVEKFKDGNGVEKKQITISQSHLNANPDWWDTKVLLEANSDEANKETIKYKWNVYGENWGYCLGFIYHPYYPSGRTYHQTTQENQERNKKDLTGPAKSFSSIVEYIPETIVKEVISTNIKTIDYDADLQRTKATSLLTYPTLVESPYISVTIGKYTFGSYDRGKEYTIQTKLGSDAYRQVKLLNKNQKLTDGAVLKKGSDNNIYAETKDGRRLLVINNYGSGKAENNAAHTISYPNFLESIDIVKINGSVNTYTINMVYQIRPGNDPNFLDKILSSDSEFRKIKISYGDSASPSFLYKEEEAVITKVTSNVDFSESRIIYSLSCTSSAVKVAGNAINWPQELNKKPSEIIKNIVKDASGKYGMRNLFPAMTSSNIDRYGWIASNDLPVNIEAKTGMDPLSYINYLVTCMVSSNSDINSPLKKSSYYLTLVDDVYNGYGGPYFTVKEVESNTFTLDPSNTYEIDIGFPGDIKNNKSNLVMSFNINNDESWALLYNYQEQMSFDNYTYNIDNSGNIITTYSPAITTSSRTNTTNSLQKTWWTNMTKYPISATLVIKGLIRATLLMTYIRINSLFYGQRHMSSGLYVVTKQEDKIDANGYRTILSLTRVAGDLDYVKTEKKKITTTVNNVKVTYSNDNYNSKPEMDTRMGEQWDIILGLVKDKNGKYILPRDMSKEDAQKLYDACLTFLEGLSVNKHTNGADVVARNIGNLLFSASGNKPRYISPIHDKVGVAQSNTLISMYNIITDSSLEISYPEVKNTNWYQSFLEAASSDASLHRFGPTAEYNNASRIINIYSGYAQSNFEYFVNQIESVSEHDIDKYITSEKFVFLCITMYNFKEEMNKWTISSGVGLSFKDNLYSNFSDLYKLVYGKGGLIPKLIDYAEKISNHRKNFTEKLKSDWGKDNYSEEALIQAGEDWHDMQINDIIGQ